MEQHADYTFSVHLSFLEIYNETMVDLLSSLKQVKTPSSGVFTVVEEPGGGVSVKGLSVHLVHNEEEALNLLFEVRIMSCACQWLSSYYTMEIKSREQ